MCQTPDGLISACGILRDSSGNLPPRIKILGSGVQPTVSSSSGFSGSAMPDPTATVSSHTGILRDQFGNLPPGTRISVVRTPTGSVIMGTTTVANLNRQISEDRAKLGVPNPYLAAFTQFESWAAAASQIVLLGGVLMTLGGPLTLIRAALIEVPPAAAVVEAVSLTLFVASIALVLVGALYYGVNCHPPSE